MTDVGGFGPGGLLSANVTSVHPQTRLNSRLQESDSRQDDEEESRRRSLSVSDHAQSSSPSFSKRKQDWRCVEGDPVVRATLQQLQQLGVDVDETNVTESEKDRLRAVESARYRLT